MSLEDFVAEIAEGKLYWFRGDRVLTVHEKAQELLQKQRNKDERRIEGSSKEVSV